MCVFMVEQISGRPDRESMPAHRPAESYGVMLDRGPKHRRQQPMSHPAAEARLRVLHVVNISDVGGAERFALGIATNLPDDRFESWVCAPRPGKRSAGSIRALSDAGIPLVTLGRRSKWDVHRLAGLVQLMRAERFDIVHAHMFGSNLWGTLSGRACRVPVVIAQEHTWSYEGNPLRVWLDGRVIGRLATRFVAVSAADGKRMIEIERVPREKVIVIPSAYVPHARPTGGDLRAELGLEQGTPLVGTAALMRPQKALEVLIDAHAQVVASVPDAHLVLVGDGSCRTELERRVRERGLADRTHFLGLRDDVDSILSALDVAALSSDFEGTPLLVFECMANDTPLVATAVGGLPDVIEHNRTGILVPPRRPDALANAVIALLEDPERRAQLAAAAAGNLTRYTIQTITARVAELYEDLAREVGIR